MTDSVRSRTDAPRRRASSSIPSTVDSVESQSKTTVPTRSRRLMAARLPPTAAPPAAESESWGVCWARRDPAARCAGPSESGDDDEFDAEVPLVRQEELAQPRHAIVKACEEPDRAAA